ncbi:MAG: PhoH family protein [Lautropia sp.]|nr:PhoH family protein [Lautropia sp.]
MPLPKAPSTRGARLDIREASRNKARMPAARRRKASAPAAEATDAMLPQLALPDLAAAPAAASPPPATHPARPAGTALAAGASAPSPGHAGSAVPPATTPARPSGSAPAVPPVSATASSRLPVTTGTRRRAGRKAGRAGHRLFVLDTNVLMHDPTALFRFQEHDVFVPMITLEELDDHKRGMSEVSRHARQVSRNLDELVSASDNIEQGIPLDQLGHQDATGRLFLQTRVLDAPLPAALPPGKADNRILSVTAALEQSRPDRQVVLVSKDINMRIKAHSLGLAAEDYFNDQVTDDLDLLYSGSVALPEDFWNTHGKDMQSWQEGGHSFYRIRGPLVPGLLVNQFVYLESGGNPLFAQVRERQGNEAVLRVVRDFTQARHAIWGITARNREQNFALNLLLDPEIDFVTLLGQAGTGKTLLALTAGLAQTLDEKRYAEIIMTRATVPVGDDIGYLPGTEEEKMQPWMGALEDNLEVLNRGNAGGDWGRAAAADLIRSRIKVKSMSFMRGRTFNNKYLIIDEAQNLTPKQMKTLATRAGPGTKVVCLGNIAQIDTPYLTEASSGLTYVVERFKGWAHGGHLTLQRGERSRLADFAAEVL